jgi:hypothetical protein
MAVHLVQNLVGLKVYLWVDRLDNSRERMKVDQMVEMMVGYSADLLVENLVGKKVEM